MRALSPSFIAALASDTTTLCHCWRLTRRDGVILGFTDHDNDILLNGTACLAASGLEASEAQAQLGLAIGGGDITGALAASSLTEIDLSSGRYDDASVEIWIVDWTDPSCAILMDVAIIGEVRRSEYSFVAELRSLAHRFDEEHGRSFQRACSADLGDARCRVDLTSAAYRTSGSVVALQRASAVRIELDVAFGSGFFTGGRLTATRGALAGQTVSIRTHAGDLLVLTDGAASLAPGDAFTITAGCDKSPETCLSKFANIANFRGFPHMPGNDVLLSYANANSPVMDGGSLFR